MLCPVTQQQQLHILTSDQSCWLAEACKILLLLLLLHNAVK